MRYLSLSQQRILFILALFILIILYFRFYYHSPPHHPGEFDREIVVEVIGEVRNPGIQIFHHSPTLKESIEKAGGLKDAAFFDIDSPSEILETGTLLNIVKESSVISAFPSHPSPFPHGGIQQDVIKVKIGRMDAQKLLVFFISLDLNRVSMEDLCLVPGIGETLAHEIVTYRESRKRFRSVEELKNVKGIGEKKYQSFKKFFIIRP